MTTKSKKKSQRETAAPPVQDTGEQARTEPAIGSGDRTEESPARAEAKRKDKVLVDYLDAADKAWRDLKGAESMLAAAKNDRKNDIASYGV